jgi:hypothetical protein
MVCCVLRSEYWQPFNWAGLPGHETPESRQAEERDGSV